LISDGGCGLSHILDSFGQQALAGKVVVTLLHSLIFQANPMAKGAKAIGLGVVANFLVVFSALESKPARASTSIGAKVVPMAT